MAAQARPASLVANMGATGSGKSTGNHIALDADEGRRRLIWDFKGEYLRHGVECKTRAELRARVLESWAGEFSLVFRPSFDVKIGRAQLDYFCGVAYELGRVLVVADELHMVMASNVPAPPGWRRLVSLGRDHDVRLIAASQRPVDFDKSFWDQATVIRAGRLNGEASARTLAGFLMVPWQDIVALSPLHWIQRSIYRPAVVRGHIGGTPARPVEVVDSEKSLIPAAPA
jgi:hypothetical protein